MILIFLFYDFNEKLEFYAIFLFVLPPEPPIPFSLIFQSFSFFLSFFNFYSFFFFLFFFFQFFSSLFFFLQSVLPPQSPPGGFLKGGLPPLPPSGGKSFYKVRKFSFIKIDLFDLCLFYALEVTKPCSWWFLSSNSFCINFDFFIHFDFLFYDFFLILYKFRFFLILHWF